MSANKINDSETFPRIVTVCTVFLIISKIELHESVRIRSNNTVLELVSIL